MLSFTLLGQMVLQKNGRSLKQFRSQKEAALLIYLAHTQQTHQRDFLADLLWQSNSTKQSLTNLRTVLARLRKQVGDDLIITRKSVTLTPESQTQVDSHQLLQTIASLNALHTPEQATTLQQALNTYHGAFLANFHLNNAPKFTEWMIQTREHIRRQLLTAYTKLGQYTFSHNNITEAATIAQHWLQADALDEAAHTLLIQCLLKAGKPQEAIAHYNQCVQLLRTELDVAPSASMTALIKNVYPQQLTIRPQPKRTQHNLPVDHNQFFGRTTIQEAIHTRLNQPWCRLVTIVGQGGVGKTRLATTMARNRLKYYADGVWFVELTNIDPDDDDLAEAIAVEIVTILNLRLNGSAKPADQLLNHLRHKEMLLVLDNFEHLLDGYQIVLDISQQCEKVQLLVTSREALQIQAEWTITLSGLSYPTNDTDETPVDAVSLFLARRAQQQQQGAQADDLRSIRAICRMVEGLPLAIELAAALTQRQTPHTIADDIRNNFDILTASLRDIPQRHRGLHIVFEMSWQTLSPTVQQQLACLSLFRGGFTQTAVSHITATTSHHLTTLTEKSLLTYHTASNRYRLHPIIRAYANQKLPSSDQTPQKHTHYYLTWLAQHRDALQKDAPQQAIAIIDPDIDNIRLAWQTSLNQRHADLLTAALPPLSIYYQLQGLAHEAEATMQTTLTTAKQWGHTSSPLLIHAGLERARFQNRLGQHRLAIDTVKTAVSLANQHNNQWAIGMGNVWWGEALWRLGKYDTAHKKLRHALNIAQQVEAADLSGWGHHQLGIIHDIQNQYEAARNHLQQACDIWRQINNMTALSNSLNSLSIIRYHQGDLPAAQQAMEQTLALCQQLDNRHVQAAVLNNLSVISREQGDYIGAQYYLQLGLQLATTNGNLTAQGEMYTNLGRNYRLLGEFDLSLQNLERGLHISETSGNRSLMAATLINLADTQSEAGILTEAQSTYEQALDIAQQDQLQRLECEALIGLAKLLSHHERDRASQLSKEAVILAQTIQNSHLLQQAQRIDQQLSNQSKTINISRQ